jgi:hypothetical protein
MSEAPTIRVRAVRRGFTATRCEISGDRPGCPTVGIAREPGDEFDCAYADLALTLDEPQLGWMEPATAADLEAVTAYRVRLASAGADVA